MNLSIGSGDVSALLSGKLTKGYQNLFRKFVAQDKPFYNATASPIDALRTGALIEKKYIDMLPDDYFCQKKSTCKEMDCFTSSIDFAKMKDGKLVDFDELKTIYLPDFLDMIVPLTDLSQTEYTAFLKKNFKANYNQVQFQMMCAELQECNLVFLMVDSYNDEENEARVLTERDFYKFRIKRDESVIAEIKNRGQIFQEVRNHFVK